MILVLILIPTYFYCATDVLVFETDVQACTSQAYWLY